jgi:hypothetical protein
MNVLKNNELYLQLMQLKNGAKISQSKQLGDCSLSSGQWLWIRITGTGDTFGRF